MALTTHLYLAPRLTKEWRYTFPVCAFMVNITFLLVWFPGLKFELQILDLIEGISPLRCSSLLSLSDFLLCQHAAWFSEFVFVFSTKLHYHLCRCTVIELESSYITLSTNRDLKYSNGLISTRKFQSVAHICGERIEVEWATSSTVNEGGFRPILITSEIHNTSCLSS